MKDSIVLSAILFLIVVFLMRIIPHTPNIVPVGALGLWAGYRLGRNPSLLLVLGVMFASDLICGFYAIPIMITVYAAMMGYSFIGVFLSKSPTCRLFPLPVRGFLALYGAMIGTFGFFIITNGAVWFFYYPRTLVGLAECLTAAIPFLAKSVAGNVLGTMIFFVASSVISYFTKEINEHLQVRKILL